MCWSLDFLRSIYKSCIADLKADTIYLVVSVRHKMVKAKTSTVLKKLISRSQVHQSSCSMI